MNKFSLRRGILDDTIENMNTQHGAKLTYRRCINVLRTIRTSGSPELIDVVGAQVTADSPDVHRVFKFYEACAQRDFDSGELFSSVYNVELPVTAGARAELWFYYAAAAAICCFFITDPKWHKERMKGRDKLTWD